MSNKVKVKRTIYIKWFGLHGEILKREEATVYRPHNGYINIAGYCTELKDRLTAVKKYANQFAPKESYYWGFSNDNEPGRYEFEMNGEFRRIS